MEVKGRGEKKAMANLKKMERKNMTTEEYTCSNLFLSKGKMSYPSIFSTQ